VLIAASGDTCSGVGGRRLQIMGIETASDYGGTNASFTSAILAIEGLFCRGRASVLGSHRSRRRLAFRP